MIDVPAQSLTYPRSRRWILGITRIYMVFLEGEHFVLGISLSALLIFCTLLLHIQHSSFGLWHNRLSHIGALHVWSSGLRFSVL